MYILLLKGILIRGIIIENEKNRIGDPSNDDYFINLRVCQHAPGIYANGVRKYYLVHFSCLGIFLTGQFDVGRIRIIF